MVWKGYRKEYLKKDILSGIVVALVSIPISMGYAQVAGLPVVYGLYGSVFPILVYGILASSPQFVVGVDATPAALVGGALASLGIASGSAEALAIVPVITLLVACWLFLFSALKAGKLVNYISKPVMGGFISGIGCSEETRERENCFSCCIISGRNCLISICFRPFWGRVVWPSSRRQGKGSQSFPCRCS